MSPLLVRARAWPWPRPSSGWGPKVGLVDAYAVKGAQTLRELQNKFGPEHVHFVVCDVTKRADLVALYDSMEL